MRTAREVLWYQGPDKTACELAYPTQETEEVHMGTDPSGHAWRARCRGGGIVEGTEPGDKALPLTDVTGVSVYGGAIV